MKKYIVTRTVHVVQAITLKANSAEDAKNLARKSKFKDFVTVNNKKRTDYSTTLLA